MKCFVCQKEIDPEWDRNLIHIADGDFVCGEECDVKFHKDMYRLCSMSNSEFINWMENNV